jgi:hypothetical protein
VFARAENLSLMYGRYSAGSNRLPTGNHAGSKKEQWISNIKAGRRDRKKWIGKTCFLLFSGVLRHCYVSSLLIKRHDIAIISK